jgi:tRNA threonylcarbamoyl adenosine modification protein YeaZ
VSALILALDTATEVTAVALGRREHDRVEVLASCDSEAPRAAMSRILPCVTDLLDSLSISPHDIDEVVVGRGPGSFTGVRIGVATAKGIAQGLGVPLYGVGSLDAIAWRITQERDLAVIAEAEGALLGVVGDAMRGEVYPARFRVVGGPVLRLDADRVDKPQAVVDAWVEQGRPMILAGNGLRKYESLFRSGTGALFAFAPEGLWSPSGIGLLGAYQASLGTPDAGSGDPGALLPIYTRLSDAEEAERERSGISSTPASGVRGPHTETPPAGDSELQP